jgi:uncharacterized membrane protein
MIYRALKHMFSPRWMLRRRFQLPLLNEIERRIGDMERVHPGELRFVVEHALELGDLLVGLTPRERALEIFGLLRVWDTELNSGILIYVLHAEHAVEIVADRGVAQRVPQAEWDSLCLVMEKEFVAGRYGEGALAAINGAAALLERHFPAQSGGRNELPDQPLLL